MIISGHCRDLMAGRNLIIVPIYHRKHHQSYHRQPHLHRKIIVMSLICNSMLLEEKWNISDYILFSCLPSRMRVALSMLRWGGGRGGWDRLVPIVTLVTVIWPAGSMGSWEGLTGWMGGGEGAVYRSEWQRSSVATDCRPDYHQPSYWPSSAQSVCFVSV